MSNTDLIIFPLNGPVLYSCSSKQTAIATALTDTQGVLLDSFLHSNPPSVFNWLLSMPILFPTYLPNQTSFTHLVSQCFISDPNYLWSVLMQRFCTSFSFPQPDLISVHPPRCQQGDHSLKTAQVQDVEEPSSSVTLFLSALILNVSSLKIISFANALILSRRHSVINSFINNILIANNSTLAGLWRYQRGGRHDS